jgi:hypothetical protein
MEEATMRFSKAVNRREFLKLTVVGAAGTALLAACGGSAAPAATQAPAKAEATKAGATT